MFVVKINTTEVGEVLFKSKCLHAAWYHLIGLIGLPVDTDGEVVDSVAKLRDQQGANGVACFTKKSANYRTNKVWYTIRTR